MLVVVVFVVAALWFRHADDRALVARDLAVSLPESCTVLSRYFDGGFGDREVAWVVRCRSGVDLRSMIPTRFESIPYSPEHGSKYQEVKRWGIERLFPGTYRPGQSPEIFVGGSGGNSFIAIEPDEGRVVLWRFWP